MPPEPMKFQVRWHVSCIAESARMTKHSTLNHFRIVKLSAEVQKEFGLPELVCADPDGMPFLEGQAFHAWLIDENACQPTTATNYLKSTLRLLTFLGFGSPSLRYTAPAEHIRNYVRAFLRERLGCAVRPHRSGNFIVTAPKAITKESVRLYLIAIRRFYEFAILTGRYNDINPLLWAKRLVEQELEFTPTMPPISGMTWPEKKGRMPATYFCVVAGDWRPQIIDDPNLPKNLLEASDHSRDKLIVRILFESGARVSEVLGLTLGDWRRRGLGNRALATNKGSRGERVKEIWWSSDTARLLCGYINGERREHDRLGRRLEELPDSMPLFINEKGNMCNYPAFYYHWQKACKRAGIKAHPHQARHWFVTMALRKFQRLSEENTREAARQSLIAYMGWKNPETLKAYDHHIRLTDFSPTHTALLQLVREGENPPLTMSTINAVSVADQNEIPLETWDRLSQLLDDEKENLW